MQHQRDRLCYLLSAGVPPYSTGHCTTIQKKSNDWLTEGEKAVNSNKTEVRTRPRVVLNKTKYQRAQYICHVTSFRTSIISALGPINSPLHSNTPQLQLKSYYSIEICDKNLYVQHPITVTNCTHLMEEFPLNSYTNSSFSAPGCNTSKTSSDLSVSCREIAMEPPCVNCACQSFTLCCGCC